MVVWDVRNALFCFGLMNCDYCWKENSSLMTIELEWVVKYNCWPCTKLYLGKYGWDISNVTWYYYNCKLIREEDWTIPAPIISRGETKTQ